VLIEICKLAGYKSHASWYKALKDERFAALIQDLGRSLNEKHPPHTEVTLARDPEAELAKDVWDLRRLKTDYPKHRGPAEYIVDFRVVANPLLRVQVKRYFRLHLPRWKAGSFATRFLKVFAYLRELPPDVHIGNLTRDHIEALVANGQKLGQSTAYTGLSCLRGMLEFMAQNAAWTGPRPPRFLVYPEDIPRRPDTLPRPVPPDVMDQLDAFLDKAAAAMKAGDAPPILREPLWDAMLIQRRTGMRTEDVCHLKAPDANGKNGCLDQDSDGYWWIRIDAQDHKMGKDHRIPTKESDGTVDAIRRQVNRIAGVEDHFGKRLLFRDAGGAMSYGQLQSALRKLAPHLLFEGQAYVISPHQFRHTIATDMIEMGIDLRTVQEFLGHESLTMTQKYVKVYLATLKKRYDEYRAKRPPSLAAVITDNMSHTVVSFEAEEDSGWLEGKVGKLYRSPLPNGLGVCMHLPMLDPCPTPPVCGFCSKLCVEKRHLPLWETALENHQRTMELLLQNPTSNDRAIQRHSPYLEKAKQIVETIRREGRYDGRIHNR